MNMNQDCLAVSRSQSLNRCLAAARRAVVNTQDLEELRLMEKRSKVPLTERREAVLSFLRREEGRAVIARRFSIADATLYR
jgi:hypothetical protein